MPEIKIEIETVEGARVNLSVGTDGLSPQHLAAVLGVVKGVSNCGVSAVSSSKPDEPGRVDFSPEPLETESEQGKVVPASSLGLPDLSSTPPELWLELSAWAKSRGVLYPKQRAIAYTIGKRLAAGDPITPKQSRSGNIILSTCRRIGFEYPAANTAPQPVPERVKPLTISDDNKNRKFTLNYRLMKLPESDRQKIRINRKVVVGMLKSLISTDFDIYCKYITCSLGEDGGSAFMSTAKEWSAVFKRFNIIDRNADEGETIRLSRIVLKMLVSRQYSLEADCPVDGAKVRRKVVTQLCKRRNSEGETVYVFAVKTRSIQPQEHRPDLVGLSSLHGQRSSGT